MKTRMLALGLAAICIFNPALAVVTNRLNLDHVLIPTEFGIDPQEFGDVLSADGNRIAVHQTLGQGLVHVFEGTPATGYTKLRTLTPPDTTFDKVSFGASLGFRGDVLYVGNPATWRSAPHDGTAYLFNLTDGALIERWTESPHTAGYFGQDGGIAGDLLYVEQGRNGTWGSLSGVYLYRVGAGGERTPIWSFIQTSPDVGPEKFPVIATRDNVFVRWSQNNSSNSIIAVFDVLRDAAQDFVGIATNAFVLDTNFFNGDYALAAQGDFLATANPYFVSGTNVCGAVLLYKKTNSSAYVQTATLLPPDLENNALFGFDLKFVSGKLVVGSPGYNSEGTNRGCIYSYAVDADGHASLVERYQPALRPFGSEEVFGSVIATAGGGVVVGSSGSRNISAKGALYFLSFTNPPATITNQAGAIFWTDVDEAAGSPNHSIKRANGDGSGISNVVTGLSHPRGMAVDPQGAKIYWTEPGLLAIRRANFDGTTVETVVSDGQAGGIALDLPGGKIYYAVDGEVRRASLDGSNSEDLVTTGLMQPVGIALDTLRGKVYWTDLLQGAGAIQRANLDGSEVETLLAGVGQANGLALDPTGEKLYWPELTAGKIQRANLDGSGMEDLVSGLGTPTTIGLDLAAGKMYWTDSGPPNYFNRIQRANLDGSGVEVIVSGVGFPWGIAVVPEQPPLRITTQPSNSTANVGSNAAFTVIATGIGPLNYQWRKDGMNLPGATNSALTLTNVQPVNIGDYSVVVSNAGDSATSSNASLTIPGVPSGIWQGLVAYYPFNGNANDESGNQNNGLVNGATLTLDRFGHAASAFTFDGYSFIEIPDSIAFKSQSFTISLWFNASQFPGITPLTEAEFLISKGQNNFELHLGAPGVPGTGNTGIRFLPRVGSGANWDTPASSYQTGRWHHVVATHDPNSTTVRVSIDGQDRTLLGPSSTPTTPDNPFNARLGMRQDGVLGLYGKLDDVRIYNRALTDQEVQQLHASEWPDTDKDGLSDSDEINIYHTDPNKRDTDGDGLSDWQEVMVYHTDPLNPDTDGDGYSDYAEIYAGKDPKNSADFPAALLSVFTAIELEFITKTNQTYFIQASSNLVTWTNYEGPILGDGGIWKKTYSSRAQGKLFYRVEKAP